VAAGVVALRPARTADAPFIAELLAGVTAEQLGLDPRHDALLLASQVDARLADRAGRFAGARREIVLLDDEPVGLRIVDVSPASLHLVDFALAASARRRGIGAAVLAALLHEAEDTGRGVSVDVERANEGAVRLYRRHGFLVDADDGVTLRMIR